MVTLQKNKSLLGSLSTQFQIHAWKSH